MNMIILSCTLLYCRISLKVELDYVTIINFPSKNTMSAQPLYRRDHVPATRRQSNCDSGIRVASVQYWLHTYLVSPH